MAVDQTGFLSQGYVIDIFTLEDPVITDCLPTAHAEDDTFIPIVHGEYTAEHIPGAQLVRFDTGGHFVAVLDEASAVIAGFIRQRNS